MSWDSGWEIIFKKRDWGTYPSEDLVRFIKSHLKVKGKKILEVGCGAGANLWFLYEQGLKVHGIDGSATAVKKAKKLLKFKKAKAKLKIGDIQLPPPPKKSLRAFKDVATSFKERTTNKSFFFTPLFSI